MHNRHGWTERTEDGDKREVRAEKFGKKWTIASKHPKDDFWIHHDPPSRHDLETLLDHLERKYQRRRASFGDIESVKKLLEDCQEPPTPVAEDPDED